MVAAGFGIGISVGLDHEASLAEFHAWMVVTPFDQVLLAVEGFAAMVLRTAAVTALLLGPLLAFIRTVPTKPAEAQVADGEHM